MRSKARCPIASATPGSSTRSRACVSASTSPTGTMHPLTPSSIRSGAHPTSSLTIAGRAAFITSFTISPHGSCREGSTKTVARLKKRGISVWLRKPQKRMLAKPVAAACRSSAARSSPSPTMTRYGPGSSPAPRDSRRYASIRWSQCLRVCSFDANRITGREGSSPSSACKPARPSSASCARRAK